jgi:hypothetical protein
MYDVEVLLKEADEKYDEQVKVVRDLKNQLKGFKAKRTILQRRSRIKSSNDYPALMQRFKKYASVSRAQRDFTVIFKTSVYNYDAHPSPL